MPFGFASTSARATGVVNSDPTNVRESMNSGYGEQVGDSIIVDERSNSILESPGPGGKELGSRLPTDDVDRKVPSIDHGPTIVCPVF